MQLGMIGLGRMGSNLVRRLLADGHEAVVYDVDPDTVAGMADEGAGGSGSVADLVTRLDTPRAVWVMVPAAITGAVIDDLVTNLDPGDVVIDGGNSHYVDSIERAARLAEQGVVLVDVGTSGGVWGRDRGFCLMIGGDAGAVSRLRPIWRALAPGVDAAGRTPGRSGEPTDEEHGFLHCGPAGAGHFVKMVHNGVEYGLMASYAEGLNILHHAGMGAHERSADAETAPLRHPEHYRYDIDVGAVTELWRRGAVVGSWLLDLTAKALVEHPGLEGYSGFVSDSGEGRWTVQAAVEQGVPAPVITTALFERFASRDRDRFASQVLSAMREQFGGHGERADAAEHR